MGEKQLKQVANLWLSYPLAASLVITTYSNYTTAIFKVMNLRCFTPALFKNKHCSSVKFNRQMTLSLLQRNISTHERTP